MSHLTVVISAYNEEKNIGDCIKSVAGLADEVIVIDNESTDKTAAIAKNLGGVVYSRPNNLMLNVNKNYGFTKATGDWIINLDADEQVTPELANEIKEILSEEPAAHNQQPITGYWLPRKNIIFGKWIEHSLWWPDEQLRLFKNGQGKFPEEHVHEYLKADGQTDRLENPLIHNNYTSINQFLYKMEHIYTENEKEQYLKQKGNLDWKDPLKKPIQEFLSNYFKKKGYQDGMHGLMLNLLQAFYTQITLAKVWEAKGFPQKEITLSEIEKEMKRLGKEIHYWLLTAKISEEKNHLKKLWFKIQRKFP